MAYYPVLRGKQFELICLREKAEFIANHGLSPIIEPVRDSPVALIRALKRLNEVGANCWLIANPVIGPLKGRSLAFEKGELTDLMLASANLNWVYQVYAESDLVNLSAFVGELPSGGIFHHGNVAAQEVHDALTMARNNGIAPAMHFFREKCGDRYRMKFDGIPAVAIEDGFKKQVKNSQYPDDEFFSDLILLFEDKGFIGFGDYLVLGDDYSEGGGPAYAVAIHVTYRNARDDGAIHIRHFVSDTNDTSDNPALKFHEALTKLVAAVNDVANGIMRTDAIEEFLRLYQTGHFPGLGYVKKLSMQHHIELMGM